MPKPLEKFLLITTDLITIHLTFFLWCRLRLIMGFYSQTSFWEVAQTSLVLYIFWYLLFALYGNYHILYTRSRIDEFITVVKTVSIGVFFIFIMTSDVKGDLSHPFRPSRLLILSYWVLLIFFVGILNTSIFNPGNSIYFSLITFVQRSQHLFFILIYFYLNDYRSNES